MKTLGIAIVLMIAIATLGIASADSGTTAVFSSIDSFSGITAPNGETFAPIVTAADLGSKTQKDDTPLKLTWQGPWSVTVSDDNAGRMYDTVTPYNGNKLSTDFQVYCYADNSGNPTAMYKTPGSSGVLFDHDLNGAVAKAWDVYYKQAFTINDAPASYKITLTFTASSTY
jgi:hypothetical protein